MGVLRKKNGKSQTYPILRILFASTKYCVSSVPINARQYTATSMEAVSSGVRAISHTSTPGAVDTRSKDLTVWGTRLESAASPQPMSAIVWLLGL